MRCHENTVVEKKTDQDCEEVNQRKVRLNFALFGWRRAEHLTTKLMAGYLSALDAVIQQSGQDAANRLRQGLERRSRQYVCLDRWSFLVFPGSKRSVYIREVRETKME